jgi:hypothetical protein
MHSCGKCTPAQVRHQHSDAFQRTRRGRGEQDRSTRSQCCRYTCTGHMPGSIATRSTCGDSSCGTTLNRTSLNNCATQQTGSLRPAACDRPERSPMTSHSKSHRVPVPRGRPGPESFIALISGLPTASGCLISKGNSAGVARDTAPAINRLNRAASSRKSLVLAVLDTPGARSDISRKHLRSSSPLPSSNTLQTATASPNRRYGGRYHTLD